MEQQTYLPPALIEKYMGVAHISTVVSVRGLTKSVGGDGRHQPYNGRNA